jgi:metallo-beta-lactamase family protein
MRIQFCGADRTVTGSSHLIEVNGLRLLLDLGMYQGPRQEARRRNALLPDDIQSLDAIILSHGHLDHCGRLPVIVKAGYRGPVYCTPATAEVARIVMSDAGKIQEEDAEYLNRRSRGAAEPQVQPLFRMTDAAAVLKLWKHTPYGQRTDLGHGVSFTFYDAGHILGSAYVALEWDEVAVPAAPRPGSGKGDPVVSTAPAGGGRKRLLFTGDVGRYHTPILRDPQPVPGAFDYVITESTYGNKRHGPMDEVGPQLLDAVRFCIEHRSRLLVPSFAVGRTQTILWYVQRFIQDKQIPPVPVFVDSPMGVEVSRVHEEFRENYDAETNAAIGKEDLFGTSKVTFASSSQESRNINAVSGACVIIASSPTCEFGRILHHLKQSVERPNDVVVFVGWTPPGTLGRRLQDGQKRVRIFDRYYDVRCQVRTIHGLSAHADGDELLRFLQPTLTGRTTAFVVHGEEDQAEAFARRLLGAGTGEAVVPAMESSAITSIAGLPPAPPLGGYVAGDRE